MTIEEYLLSEQAVADVAAIISKARGTKGGLRDSGQHGAWRCIESTSEVGLRAYFCCDGDRFDVTDLGEAVVALRKRTAWTGDPTTIYDEVPGAPMLFDGRLVGVTPKEDKPTAADLPRTICRVMLAAYRVSRLEVKP